MRSFFSSTLLLGAGAFTHALRVIILSFLLGNRDFGAVSTILLISTLFAEFGSFGFSRLVYNQRLFTPGMLNRESVNIGRFLATGLSIIGPMAVLVALVLSVAGPFHFATLFGTLICAGANVMLLSSCRASNDKFTHPVGYFLKSLIVLVDIAVLGWGHLAIETIALWGEILSTPVLLFYVWRSGIFRWKWSIFRKAPGLVAANWAIAFSAVLSSMTALLFLNQERMAGAFLLTLEQMGIITKIILIKIIGAQSAFIFGTYFHRHIIGSDDEGRAWIFSKIRQYEVYAYPALLALCFVMIVPIELFYREVYEIELAHATTISAMLLGITFFFNPFAILLHASGRFGTVARYNALAIALFMVTAIFSFDSAYLVIVSALSAVLWYLLIRRAAYKLFDSAAA